VHNFLSIAYLRMSKLKHLPANPFVTAVPAMSACYAIVAEVKFHTKEH
jgi:hypothetical protein